MPSFSHERQNEKPRFQAHLQNPFTHTRTRAYDIPSNKKSPVNLASVQFENKQKQTHHTKSHTIASKKMLYFLCCRNKLESLFGNHRRKEKRKKCKVGRKKGVGETGNKMEHKCKRSPADELCIPVTPISEQKPKIAGQQQRKKTCWRNYTSKQYVCASVRLKVAHLVTKWWQKTKAKCQWNRKWRATVALLRCSYWKLQIIGSKKDPFRLSVEQCWQ